MPYRVIDTRERYLVVFDPPYAHFYYHQYTIYNPSTNCGRSRYVQLSSTLRNKSGDISTHRHSINPQTNKQETKGQVARVSISRSSGAQAMHYVVIDTKRKEYLVVCTPVFTLEAHYPLT